MPVLPPDIGPYDLFTSADPAAGAYPVCRPVQGNLWRVHSIHFRLVTDANVANRRILFCFPSGAAVGWHFLHYSPAAQVASTTYDYILSTCTDSASHVSNVFGGTNIVTMSLYQPIMISYDYYPDIMCENFQATDNFSAVQFLGERYLTS